MKLCKNYINGEWVDSVSGKTALPTTLPPVRFWPKWW